MSQQLESQSQFFNKQQDSQLAKKVSTDIKNAYSNNSITSESFELNLPAP